MRAWLLGDKTHHLRWADWDAQAKASGLAFPQANLRIFSLAFQTKDDPPNNSIGPA